MIASLRFAVSFRWWLSAPILWHYYEAADRLSLPRNFARAQFRIDTDAWFDRMPRRRT